MRRPSAWVVRDLPWISYTTITYRWMAPRQVGKDTHSCSVSSWGSITRHRNTKLSISLVITLLSIMDLLEGTIKTSVSTGNLWALSLISLFRWSVLKSPWMKTFSLPADLCKLIMPLLRTWRVCHLILKWCWSVRFTLHRALLQLRSHLNWIGSIRNNS